MAGSWSIAIAGYFITDSSLMAGVFMKASYATAVLGLVYFFYFAIYFKGKIEFSKKIAIIDLLVLLGLVIIIMVSPLIIRGVEMTPLGKKVDQRAIGWTIYTIYLMVHFVAAHSILFIKYLRAEGVARRHILYVMIGIFFGMEIFSIFFNLFLPSPIFNNWNWIWVGPVASVLFIVPAISFAILKYRLFYIRGLLSEALILFSMFLVLLDTLLSEDPLLMLLRATIFIILAFLSIILVKKIRNEEKQKRKLQRLATALSEANRKLEQQDEMKSEFISMASHQLRTPVSVMKGYLSLIMDGSYGRVSKKVLARLEQMYEMNERLILLINNMLNMARIEKNRIDFGFKEIRMNELIAGVMGEMSYKAEQKGLELKFDNVRQKVPVITSDEEKIREILINLIDNSIKYTSTGSITVSLKVDKRDKNVKVYVADTGAGMGPKDAVRIFEKFYRVLDKDVPKESGTGLGLYIVTKFLSGMGGRIWIEKTAPGEGTTFAFEIPFNPPKKDKE
jgi:signal transduction histidine kinase